MDYPWFKRFAFRYNQKLLEWLKQMPGCRWNPEDKTWSVPIEMIPAFEKEAAACKVKIQESVVRPLPKLVF